MDPWAVVLLIAVSLAVVLIFVALARKEGGWAAGLLFFWPMAVPLYIIYLIRLPAKRRQAAEEARRAAEEARRRRHREEQESHRNEMVALGESSVDWFEALPRYLDYAEQWLDRAALEFADGAFAPFWDCIEKATENMAHYDEGVRRLKDFASSYTSLVSLYEATPPQFPLARESVDKLGVGVGTAERMQAIARKAQRDFQFAMIYEQRKTNQILVAGFKSLAHALEQMTWQITASINDLAGSVDVMTSTLDEALRAIHSRMGDIATMTSQHHDERAARERKALEMLDNIQRGRRPSL